jgi:hypothetical protein
MEFDMLYIAEFTNYSHKQCKANSGKECQDFRGVTMVIDMNIMQWLKDFICMMLVVAGVTCGQNMKNPERCTTMRTCGSWLSRNNVHVSRHVWPICSWVMTWTRVPSICRM